MLRAALLSVLLLASGGAQACGVCVEDKMAAVYDHAVVTRALGQKHHVAFFHVEGRLASGKSAKSALEKAAESSLAEKGSVRASTESAALAVAFDPRRTPVARLQKDLERRLAARKLSLMLLRVLEHPVDVNPGATRALHVVGKQAG